MRYEKTVNVCELIENSSLAKIMKKGLFLNELNIRLQRLFPAQYQGLYQVADLNENELIFEVANAMVRQALLFRQQELLDLVHRDYPTITKLKFSINPELARR